MISTTALLLLLPCISFVQGQAPNTVTHTNSQPASINLQPPHQPPGALSAAAGSLSPFESVHCITNSKSPDGKSVKNTTPCPGGCWLKLFESGNISTGCIESDKLKHIPQGEKAMCFVDPVTSVHDEFLTCFCNTDECNTFKNLKRYIEDAENVSPTFSVLPILALVIAHFL